MDVGCRTDLGAQLLDSLPVGMFAQFRERDPLEMSQEREPFLTREPDRHCGFTEVRHADLLMRGVRRMVVETGRSIFSFSPVASLRPSRPWPVQLTWP